MKFSIVIVTYNRKKDLENCLESLKFQVVNHNYEVIVIFNGELSYLEKTKIRFPAVNCFYTPSVSPSAARNLAILKCKGEYILFLDDDCTIPLNYFLNVNFDDNWDVLGGPDQTSPVSSIFQKTLGHALSSPLCMGKTYFRHTAKPNGGIVDSDESRLILCNLWVKTSIFQSEGHKFDSDLFRNEENFLLKKLKLENKRIVYNTSMYVYHNRRNAYGSLATSIVRSGECRVLNFMKLPIYTELIYILPLFFVILFFLWMFNLSSILSLLFVPYFSLVYSLGIYKTKNLKLNFLFMHLFILFMYSMGLTKGLLQHSWLLMKDYSRQYS